ncbi:MAG: copper homeostasis protein CutC [Saprospiraceae bacterium]
MKIKIEVCAASVQSALTAQLAGAQRVELCSSLELGGITPSASTIEKTKEILDIEVYVLIRPRPGDFFYSSLEFDVIKRDILFCKNVKTNDGKKVDGVVIGILQKDGQVDVERTKELVELAAPMKVTFHRAFDRAIDPFLSLEKIIETGAHRILTSGQFADAFEGRFFLKELVEKANGRISIMPGAGVNAENILELAKTTQAKEFHLSGKGEVKSKMTFENPNFDFSENDFFETDLKKIMDTVKVVSS